LIFNIYCLSETQSVKVKNLALSMHTKWEKLSQIISRRHQNLEENRRRSSSFLEKLSDLNYFILEKFNTIECEREQLDPRQSKAAFTRQQKTEEEIKNNEKFYDQG